MIRPSRGYVLVEPMEPEEMTAAGVYLPDRVKDLPQKGKVLAVGDWNTSINYDATKDVNIGIPIASITEAQLVYPPCKVGDTVI
ncbi:MAG: co-chaperone GroES family protein, partial [Nanoarchaeota archaeon]